MQLADTTRIACKISHSHSSRPFQWHALSTIDRRCTPLPISQDTPLLVAEERTPGWAIVYRGTIASAGTTEGLAALEDALPVWLLEYLLLGRTPQVVIVKIQFALLPGEDSLPELVNP